MNKTTIVVPVYKDWSTLSSCIESLKKYVPSGNSVLLINDCGPEWEELEHNILSAIADCPNFTYAKNEENLGFVKTCNHSRQPIFFFSTPTRQSLKAFSPRCRRFSMPMNVMVPYVREATMRLFSPCLRGRIPQPS